MRAPALLALLALAGCDDMIQQAKRTGYRASSGQAASPAAVPAGTVDFASAAEPPPPLDLALLQRGQSQYRQFCTPCHSELGDGNGMVAQRGFEHPPAYTAPKILHAPTQHYYDVLSNGAGAMYSFAQRIAPADRWAIAAYIRALQVSAAGQLSDLPPQDQARLVAP